MICYKFKRHAVHVGMKLFSCPRECQGFFFGLRISSLCVRQATTCIADDSWSILLPLGQHRSQSDGVCVGNHLGWCVFVKVPHSFSTSQPLFQFLKPFLCSPPNTKSVPDFVRYRKGSEMVARSGINRPQ